MTPLKLLRLAWATLFAFVCLVDIAHADPFTAALGAAWTAISSAVAAVPLLGAAISMGAQFLLGKLMQKPQKQKGIKEKLQSGGNNPLSFIMGEVATAGKLVYVNQTGGENNRFLTLTISLSEVPLTSFSNYIWINGERCTIDYSKVTQPDPHDNDPVFDSDAPRPGFFRVIEYDKNGNSKYNRAYCWVKFYDGTQTTNDAYLTSTFGGDDDKPWTSDMIGRGCAYAIVVVRYSVKGIWSGIPEFKFVVRGIPLYDVSKDSTQGGSGSQRWNNPATWTYSENPKVMAYNVIRGIYYGDQWLWGGQIGLDAANQYQLPSAYWIAAIAHCNETVTHADDTTSKRYTAACEIEVDHQPIDIIRELDKTCTGYTTEYAGVWKTWAGPPGTSIYSFTDDDIIITEEQTDDLFKVDTYNGARATYLRPSAGWVMKDAAPLYLADLLEEDNNVQQIADLQFSYVTEVTQAHRLKRIAVLDSRRQITHTLVLPPSAYVLEPFDVTNWNSARNGYVNKKFQVQAIDDLPNGNQLVTLRETNPADYDWDVTYELPESVGPLTPIRPGQLALDFSVSADQVDSPTSTKDKPAIRIEWTWGAEDIDLDYVKWEVRRSAAIPKVIAHGTFYNIADDDRTLTSAVFRFKQSYQVRLYAQPVDRSRESSWTVWKNVTLYDIDIPGSPVLTRVSDLGDDGTLDFYLDIDWTAILAEGDYQVRVAITGGPTRTYRCPDNSLRLPVTSGKTYTVDVRFIAADGGTRGDWSGTTAITITKKNTAPTTPAGLALTAGFKVIALTWDKSPDKDYFATRVYRSLTNNFADAVEVHQKAGSGWNNTNLSNQTTYYYWITHLDKSGNESAKWPVSNTGGISGTTQNVSESDVDGTQPPTPTGLTLSQQTDLNGDGKVEVRLVVSFTGNAGKKGSYVIRINDGTDITYRYFKDVGNGSPTSYIDKFAVISGKTYVISVASSSFAGVISNYTANVSLTPNKKTTAPTAPTGLTASGWHKSIKLAWPKSPDSDYNRTIIYRSTTNNFASATELDRIHGTAFTDGGLTNRTTYYYWITFEDRSFNESAKYPVSNTAGASATAGVIVTDDFAAGAVNDAATDQTTPNAPGVPALTSLTADIDGDGAVDTGLSISWTAPASGVAVKSYELELWSSSTLGGTYTLWRKFPVVSTSTTVKALSTKFYKGLVRGLSFNGTPGAASALTSVGVKPAGKSAAPSAPTGLTATLDRFQFTRLKWNACPDKDYAGTNIYRTTAPVPGVTTLIATVVGTQFIDAEINTAPGGAGWFYTIAHVDNSGNESSHTASPVPGLAVATIDGGDIDDTSVPGTALVQQTITADKIYPGAVNEAVHVSTLADVATFGTSATSVQTISIPAQSLQPAYIRLDLSIRNRSGAAKTFDIAFVRGDGTTISTNSGVPLNDNETFTAFGRDANPLTAATTYDVVITSTTTGNKVGSRRLMAEIRHS